jgi:protein tyrosine phosphatase type 4A
MIFKKELVFEDGGVPSESLVEEWLELCQLVFSSKGEEGETLAVHCVAGLGRTPLLVAIAIVQSGAKYMDAVELIRSKRERALNAKQIKFLKGYKPKKKCVIM